MYITQNSFMSAEIAECDVISGDDVDVEERFDRLVNDAEIEQRVRQSVPSATRYKAGFPLANIFARSDFFPLSLSFRLKPSGTN